MSLRRDRTLLENNIFNIFEKLIEMMNKSIDIFQHISSSVTKADLIELDKIAEEIKYLTEMMIK